MADTAVDEHGTRMQQGDHVAPLTSSIGGFASIGAGVVHALAAGGHSQHAGLARIFVLVSLAQISVGLFAVLRRADYAKWMVLAVNGFALCGWIVTRFVGISWIAGLEVRESPTTVDTLCAVLGSLAVVSALSDVLYGAVFTRRFQSVRAFAVSAVAVSALWSGAGTTHDHATASAWPRAYDPTQPVDLSGVPGVTAEQEARATQLIKDTQRELPRWADVNTAIDEGWKSIGDASTGFEHYIKRSLIVDGKFLDPTAPESLVYQVDGDKRTLVSAMFIANPTSSIDSPELLNYAGPLMQWHVHNNLCWTRSEKGAPVIAGITDANGKCPPGSVLAGIGIPMVHVWISAHQCGPFAALEGVGAGTASVPDAQRADLCGAAHTH